jgi:bacterial/archaeal transporter family-2 protein
VSRGGAVLLVALAGCLVGMQPPVNARLGRAVGTFPAAAISFLVGTLALVAIAAVAKPGLGGLGGVGRVPWWALIGGLLGAVYVTVSLVTVRTLGTSGLTAIVIAGQLTIAVAIDRFGLLGIPKQPVGAVRVLGLVLLVVGVVLVVRR